MSQSCLHCFRCGSPNHLTRDCMQCNSIRNWRERSTIRCYLSNKTGHLSPFKLKEVLPVIEDFVNGKKHIALMDSGCSQSLVTRLVCNWLSRQTLDILTVNSEIPHSDCIGTIMLAVDKIRPIKADVLVMDSLLLDFSMLIRMDIITMLSGVRISQSNNATFSKMELYANAAIRIEKLDFSVEFDEWIRVWTALWNWSLCTYAKLNCFQQNRLFK